MTTLPTSWLIPRDASCRIKTDYVPADRADISRRPGWPRVGRLRAATVQLLQHMTKPRAGA